MAINSLSALTEQVEKLLGLLKQVDVYAAGGAGGGGGVMNGSLAKVNSQAPGFWGTVGKAMGGMATVASGASQMMPDVAMTVAREGGIYGAGVSSGAIVNRGQLERTTRLGLGQFQTFAGATGVISATLAGRGLVPGTAAFGRTVTEVGQAARYLNMGNMEAANAFENFTSGPTSANMMRNFGVFTADPVSGKTYSQNEIFQQMKSRFLGGRTTTVERTMESLRRGFLGSNLRNSGLSGEQQSILSSQFIANSMGVNLDFSDPKSIDKLDTMLKEKGYENPFLSQMKLESKDDELMETATQPYLAGIKDATGALIELKNFTRDELIPTFGQLKATLDTLAGNPSATGGLGMAVGAGLTGAALFKGMSGNAKAATAANAAGNTAMAAKLGGKALGMSGVAGAVMSIPGVVNAAQQGAAGAGVGNAVGSIAGSMIGGAIGQALIPIPGVGFVLGSIAGSMIGGGAGNAIGSMFDQKPKGATGGGGNIDPGPVGNSFTGAYGEKRPYGVHEGVDVPLPVGVQIKAVMDGVVKFSGNGSGSLSRGLYIEIAHGSGMLTQYAHLSKSLVQKGNVVAKGDVIGYSGNSGYSTGPHLHFALYIGGKHQNPNGLVGLAYGGGGNKKQFAPPTAQDNPNGLTPEELAAGMTADSSSGSSSVGVVSNNFSTGISGVYGGGANAKQILESILGSAEGSLGSVASTSSSTSLPEPISADSKSGVMGGASGVGGSTTSGSATGAGGGYEPAGLKDVDYMSTSIDVVRKGSGRQLGTSPNVTINLSIAQASESEAKKFAKMVKEILEEDNMLKRMAGK